MKEIEEKSIAKQNTRHGNSPQWGRTDNGSPFINRFAYASEYSKIYDFVTDERFEPIRKLIGHNAVWQSGKRWNRHQ